MSETASSTDTVTIYIPLLNEGTEVYRPTRGKPMGSGRYEVLPTTDYNDGDEEWQYPPGSLVECVVEKRAAGDILIARRYAVL